MLAGGGARGAYALGALSVLLPFLHARDEEPTIYVGASIGAVQVAYLAARAGDRLDCVLREGREWWQGMDLRRIVASPWSPRQLRLTLRYCAMAIGLPVLPPPSILAPKSLNETLTDIADFDGIERNVRSGALAAVAVVATSSQTGRSVVFHDGGGHPKRDRHRGIDYFSTRLSPEHVLASAAIPSAFPAVHVGEPEGACGWYVDGGTRLNTPIKPALRLGANALVIVGVTSNRPGGESRMTRPDAIDGGGHLTQAVLADPLHDDVVTLARLNEVAAQAGKRVRYEEVPYILVAPKSRDAIGEVAQRVYRARYTGLRRLGSRRLRLLGRLLNARGSAQHGELMSYLFFAREFVDELAKLGAADAETWLKARHDDGPWRLGPPP